MTLPPAADVERVIRAALTIYREHIDADDIIQEARIAVWRALSRAASESGWARLATVAARTAAAEFLRSPLNRSRQHVRYQHNPALRFVSLSGPLSDDCGRWLTQPDFTPAVVERLAARAMWEEGLPRLTRREREAFLRHFGRGLSLKATGEELGIGESAVRRLIQAAVDRYRRRWGVLSPGARGAAVAEES